MHIKKLKLVFNFLGIVVLFIIFSYYTKYNYPYLTPKNIDINNNSIFNSNNNFNLDNLNLNNNLNNVSANYSSQDRNWFISIPKINLECIEIKDSIESDILENYIGHFPTSSMFDGNVCLAAHNAGFKHNYFCNLIHLDIGDEIIYSYLGNIKKYYVSNKYTIDENDFNMLNNEQKDKITLVTCVSGSPELRLCIEGLSKEEFSDKNL